MLNPVASSGFMTSSPVAEPPEPVRLSLDGKDEDMPRWLLLIILSVKVAVLILLFQSGLGLIGLGLCAMGMSLFVGEREGRRRAHGADAARGIAGSAQHSASCSSTTKA